MRIPTVTTLAASLSLAALTAVPVAASPGGAGAPSTVEGQATGCERQFQDALDTHLTALDERDLDTLASTIDEDVVLIFPSGTTLYGKDAFMNFHTDWFASEGWTQDNTVVHTNVEGCKTAWASVDYVYRTYDESGTVTSESHNLFALTWTRDRGQWVVVADQNTAL